MQIEQSLALHVENPEQSVQWFCKYISIIETFWTTFTQNVIFRINKKNCMITSFHHYYFVIINYHYYSENILYRAIKSHWPAKLIGPWNSNRDTFFIFCTLRWPFNYFILHFIEYLFTFYYSILDVKAFYRKTLM